MGKRHKLALVAAALRALTAKKKDTGRQAGRDCCRWVPFIRGVEFKDGIVKGRAEQGARQTGDTRRLARTRRSLMTRRVSCWGWPTSFSCPLFACLPVLGMCRKKGTGLDVHAKNLQMWRNTKQSGTRKDAGTDGTARQQNKSGMAAHARKGAGWAHCHRRRVP